MLFNAICFVWNEEDIIRSAVLHALHQGCDNVFLIDNGSDDATVRTAREAGAKLAAIAPSDFFNTREKTCHLNAFVRYYNSLHFDDEVWWMYFDADEFMHPHTDCTLRELIERAKGCGITALKGFFYNHMPTHPPYNVEGYHPIDFMPLCDVSTGYKIPIIKYTYGEKHIFSAGGAHEISTDGERLTIADDAIAIHHFQHRRPEATLSRLKKLLPRLDWMNRRSEFLYHTQSAYESRYARVKEHYRRQQFAIFRHKTLPYSFAECRRWYDSRSGEQFKKLVPMESALAQAFYYDFLGEPTIALCRYNDLLSYPELSPHTNWILLKIADCFAQTDRETANRLYETLRKTADAECVAHIDAPPEPEITEKKKNALRVIRYSTKFAVDPAPLIKRMREIERQAFAKAEIE